MLRKKENKAYARLTLSNSTATRNLNYTLLELPAHGYNKK